GIEQVNGDSRGTRSNLGRLGRQRGKGDGSEKSELLHKYPLREIATNQATILAPASSQGFLMHINHIPYRIVRKAVNRTRNDPKMERQVPPQALNCSTRR